MILIKEEMIGGEKWRRAVALGGSDAIVLWLALKCYCSQHPDTEGFVPDEVIAQGLPGAPRRTGKALDALVGCGRRLPDGKRGPGLIDHAQHGWRLHDYLDHAASPEEIELRREKARLRKQTYRESKRRELEAVRRLSAALGEPPLAGHPIGDTAGHVPWDMRDTEGDNPGDIPGVSPAGARPPGGARVCGPARAGARPNPAQPSPNQKTLERLLVAIREPRELGPTVEACPAHRQFAAEHGLELGALLDELRGEPASAGLSRDQLRARLGELLERAAGGAA